MSAPQELPSRHCGVKPHRGALQYQMDTGVRLTLPKAGAWHSVEHNLKQWRVIGWEAKFWFKIRGILGENVTFDFSVSSSKAGIEKNIVENGKNDQFVDEIETKSSFLWQPNTKNRGFFLGESDQRAHISPKNVGSLDDSRDNQQKYGVIGWQQHWK